MNVFITGANRGIGLEFCRQLLAQSPSVQIVAAVRQPAQASALSKLSESNDNRIHIVELDVANDAQVASLSSQVGKTGVPSFDWIINNAGVGIPAGSSFKEFDFDVFRKSFEINSIGPFKVLKALASHIKPGCKILQISSLMGSVDDNRSGGAYAYRASKSALNMINRSFAIDNKDLISVVLHPGWVQTDMGGPNAEITTEESVRGMIAVAEKLTAQDSGGFRDHTGKVIPW